MDWQNYFETMMDWKKLPAYKAEPRIDSLIGYYLPSIVSDFFKDKIVGIIPELPIRLAMVDKKYEYTNLADRSYKVDFYLLGETGINYFVEFKTDSTSRREKQDNYLLNSQKVGMDLIIQGITKISRASSYKKKYNHLKDKLIKNNLISDNNSFIGKNEIKNIYVQPKNIKNDLLCIDFRWISNWLESKKEKDTFEKYFANALKVWAID